MVKKKETGKNQEPLSRTIPKKVPLKRKGSSAVYLKVTAGLNEEEADEDEDRTESNVSDFDEGELANPKGTPNSKVIIHF